MKRTKVGPGWVIITVLAVFSTLTWFFWSFVRDVIVVPIYYLIWLLGLVMKSIPQGFFVVVLAIACLIIALNTLFRVPPRSSDEVATRYRSVGGGRYQFWNRMLVSLHRSPFSRDDFSFEARKLILAILAYQEGVDLPTVERLVVEQKISVPVSVMQLVLTKKLALPPKKENSLGRKLAKFFHRPFLEDAQGEQMIADQAKEIIHFIEFRLEISHDEQ